MKILTIAADITKAIKSIQTRGGKLDADIHAAGVAVLKHANAHGDTTLADALVNAMPKGSRKLALVEWMLAFGTMRVLDNATEKEAIQAGRHFAQTKDKVYNEADAIATPWTDYRKEPAVSLAFDAQAAVQALIARLNKAQKAGVNIENRAHALNEAQALVAILSAPLPKHEEAPL